MPGHRQQTELRQLEALFEDVALEEQHQQPTKQTPKTASRVVRIETKVDKCCEVHGTRSREGTPTKTVTTTITTNVLPSGRRGSLQMPAAPSKKDAHPSNFASSLRKDSLGSSMSSITKKEPIRAPSPSVRRDSLGRSMSSLKKESAYDPPKKDLQKTTPPPKRENGAFSPSLSSTAKIRSELMSKSTSSLKVSSAKVGFRSEPRVGPVSSPGKTTRTLYDSKKFSADSLENLSSKRHSWDHTRRGSSGSSSGSPIWEERDFETSVDEVTFVLPIFFFFFTPTRCCSKVVSAHSCSVFIIPRTH